MKYLFLLLPFVFYSQEVRFETDDITTGAVRPLTFDCGGQTIDKNVENIVRKVLKEEAINTETMEARFEAIIRRVLDEKLGKSEPIAIPDLPVSSPLKILSPVHNQKVNSGEVITVKIDVSDLPEIAEYKVYMDGILRDTDLKSYTPYIFPASIGNKTIRVDAKTLTGVVYSSSINISVK